MLAAILLLFSVTAFGQIYPYVPPAPHSGGGGITLDHNASGNCASACSGAPAVLSVSFTATAGTHIILEGLWCDTVSCGGTPSSADIASVSNGTDTFVQKVAAIQGTIGTYIYEVSSATGGTHTITLTFNTGVTAYYATMLVSSWNGLVSGDAFDTSGTFNGSGSNPSCTTSGNLTQSSELILGWMDNGGAGAVSAGSGFTLLNAPVANDADEYKVGGASGSAATATFVSPSGTNVVQCSAWEHV